MNPSVVGNSPSGGGAVAGQRVAERKVPTYISGRQSNFPLLDYSHKLATSWVDVTVNLNLSEIQRKLSEKGKLRSADAWSREVDRAVRSGVLKEGTMYLMTDVTLYDLIEFGIVTADFAILSQANVPLALGNFLLCGFIFNGVHRSRAREPFRWSVLPPGPQLDRAAIFYTRSKTSKVVKALPVNSH